MRHAKYVECVQPKAFYWKKSIPLDNSTSLFIYFATEWSSTAMKNICANFAGPWYIFRKHLSYISPTCKSCRWIWENFEDFLSIQDPNEEYDFLCCRVVQFDSSPLSCWRNVTRPSYSKEEIIDGEVSIFVASLSSSIHVLKYCFKGRQPNRLLRAKVNVSRPVYPGARPQSGPLTNFSFSLKFSLDRCGFVVLWRPDERMGL
jgi:hypothetical protein